MSEAAFTLEIVDAGDLPASLHLLAAQVANATAAANDLHGTVALRVCGDAEMHQLNQRFRGVDEPTDVLAFPAAATAIDDGVAGDIAVSYERIVNQGREFGHGSEREFAYLLTHALLHLAGHSHQESEGYARMREIEEQILASLGLSRETTPAA